MKTKRILATLALAGAMVLTACGGQKSSDNQSQTKTEGTKKEYTPATVRVAYMPNLGSASSLFTAMDQGYFKEVGLDVKPVQFQGGPAEITAMASGDIDISQIGHGAHALCIEGKAKIFQMDSTTSLADEVVANKAHGINKKEDLKGKTIAVASGTSSEVILRAILESAGLKESDVNLVEMAVDGMTTAMVSDKVDACATWSPNTVTLKKAMGDKYLSLGSNADYLDKATFPSSFITTEAYAQKNEDVLVRFSQAINKAHIYRADHIDDVAKSVAKHIDAPEETLLASTKEGDWTTINQIAGDKAALQKVYETQQNVFIGNGRIKEKVETDKYVLYDIIQKGYEASKNSK
nr:ABC transporter substrate-binding protein [uncultured Shuttleworthia sp.]